MGITHKQESSALARCQQLAKRSAFDLNLAHDAAVSAQLTFVHLARIKRARREMIDLLRELSGKDRGEAEEKSAA
jgi:endonuclease/exonuclease/phosphatase family metal-dependent hydrolase